jgi:hypothetical protein
MESFQRRCWRRFSIAKLPLIGFLRSSPLWSFQRFASGRLATPGSTSLNVTFASA